MCIPKSLVLLHLHPVATSLSQGADYGHCGRNDGSETQAANAKKRREQRCSALSGSSRRKEQSTRTNHDEDKPCCSGEGQQGPGTFQLPVLRSRLELAYMETHINSPLLYFGWKRQNFLLSSERMRFPVLQDRAPLPACMKEVRLAGGAGRTGESQPGSAWGYRLLIVF